MSQPHRVRSGSPFEETIGFCRALRAGDRVLVAGTAPIGPGGACPEDAGEQARLCFLIVERALAELGVTNEQVVRTRMFLTNASDAGAIGRVHGEFYRAAMPVSTMVVVGGLLDPRWKVEVEAEAWAPEE